MSNERNITVISETINILGEGIYYIDNYVYWLDIELSMLYLVELDKKIEECYQLPEQATAILDISNGGVVLATESGICTFYIDRQFWEINSQLKHLSDHKYLRSNDGCKTEHNSYLFGIMSKKSPSINTGTVFLLSNNIFTKLLDHIAIPNTFVLIGRNSFLISDSLQKLIYIVTLNSKSEKIDNISVWLDLSSQSYTPDGGCIDKDGNVYIAMWDGFCIIKYDKEGNILDTINIPVPRPTNCIISSDSKNLFVSSATEGLSLEEVSKYPLSGRLLNIELKK